VLGAQAIFLPGDNNMVGFIQDGDVEYAGRHLLIDLYNCQRHGTQEEIKQVMIDSCLATGATVLYSYLHPFTGGGISGAVILAESHQSIHTWPELGFVSLDIFVCGDCDPELALPLLLSWFQPQEKNISFHRRGVMPARVFA
jgi:S-adenosylmethionine decarboxylase